MLRLIDKKGNQIISPILLDQKYGNNEYHAVQSAYGKDGWRMLVSHILDIKYLNKKEGLAFLTAIGLQSPQRVTLSPSFIGSIPDEEDLRKYKVTNPGLYR